MKNPILTPHELAEPTWLKLKKHYENRLDELRRQNDSEKLGEIETARLRGRIKEIKFFLDIGTPTDEEDED
ncbi:MAG: hypothetical protein WC208_13545 [Gallionella sp.]|jgi:hypothetical protein